MYASAYQDDREHRGVANVTNDKAQPKAELKPC